MSGPISVSLPHQLGAEEAKRRIAANLDGLVAQLPANARVTTAWNGDELAMGVAVLGQSVDARILVEETLVRVSILLPPALGMFRDAIARRLGREAGGLLADSGKSAR